MKILDVGGGDGSRAKQTFPNDDILTIDLKSGWDIEKRGLPLGQWDYIFANHIIEHLHNPDFLLDECRRIMQPHTVLDIGTPNLAAWFNRILLLFGYVPHSMEVSCQFNVGKPFDWNEEGLGGHIHIFTIPAMLQLLENHHFKVISVVGEGSTFKCAEPILWVDKLLTRMNKNFASAFRIKCVLQEK